MWAEEPDELRALWKQRLRWSRGNLQVTRRYRGVWFRPFRRLGLGGITFGLAWFTVLLQPLSMIAASIALVSLLVIGDAQAWAAFHLLWIVNAVCYLFTTAFSFAIDPRVARSAWREGILFPGIVSVAIIVITCLPGSVGTGPPLGGSVLGWFLCIWLAACMAVAWLALQVEHRRGGRVVSRLLIYVSGYGAFLCLVTLTAYVREIRGTEQRWDKTEKRGRALLAP